MGARPFVDDDRAADWDYGGGIKVEGAIGVFPRIHVQGKGGLAEEVQGEFCLREDLIRHEVGEVIGYSSKDGIEVGF